MTQPEESGGRRLEYELKFLVPASRAAFLRSWIASAVRPDVTYPPARVVTVYFDTRGLDFLGEKVDSDYLKTKARIRWYAGLAGEEIGSPVFAECKYRLGATRRKVRVRLPLRAADVSAWPLTSPAWATQLNALRAEAPQLPPELTPTMRLRYVRCRFLDRDGARVTLDSDIRLEAINPARVAEPVVSTPLPTAVFEYKGKTMELPRHLAPVVRFGARQSSFSKYLACYEHLSQAFL